MIVSLLIGLLVMVALYVGSHRLSGAEALIAVVSFAGGALLIVFPWLATDLAQRLNVGRGTDLILYVTIVLNAFLVANFYFRFKRDEQIIVKLVRAIALRDARVPHERGPTSRIEP